MPGHARAHPARSGAAAQLALGWLVAQTAALAPAPPPAFTVGRVTVWAAPAQAGLAAALAEAADRTPPFPGIGPLPARPLGLVLAPTRAQFDSLTQGRLPRWTDAAALPERGVVVLFTARPSAELGVALRHELAHLALEWRVRRPLPLWFEEGYAAVAAGEWDRLELLRLNWQVARGVRLDLDQLDRALRGDAAEAATAYGLATTAVLLLERWGGERGLAPLLDRLASAPSFDAALRATYHVTEGDFEARWQREVATRYGWLGWLEAVGGFWAVAGLGLGWLVWLRRRRDRVRKARLDDDWPDPGPDPGPDAPTA